MCHIANAIFTIVSAAVWFVFLTPFFRVNGQTEIIVLCVCVCFMCDLFVILLCYTPYTVSSQLCMCKINLTVSLQWCICLIN